MNRSFRPQRSGREPVRLVETGGTAAFKADTLDGIIARLEAENERLRAILADFVCETDEWNARMEKIVGKPTGYCWEILERARAELSR